MADPTHLIAKRLNTLITESKTLLTPRLGASDSADGLNAEQTLSNTSLLLESLETFYSDPKSEFFPTIITNAIRDCLISS